MLLPRQSKAIPRQRCTQNTTLREITQTPPSESHRLLMSLPRIPIVTHAQTDATHQLSHVRRQVCHVRTVGDRQRHTPSECYTCMLLRLPCAEWLHHGDIHYQPMDASLGQSAPLFSGQKSVRIASHALECRRPSLGRTLPVYRPNKRPSECPRWHDISPKTRVSTLVAPLAPHPLLTELTGVSRTIESSPLGAKLV